MKRFMQTPFHRYHRHAVRECVHAQRQTTQETLIRNATVLTVTRGTLDKHRRA